MAKFNQKTILQPLAAFSMTIILGIYVRHAINESRRDSRRRTTRKSQLITIESYEIQKLFKK